MTVTVYAFPEGVLGYHGAESSTCTRCHTGGTAPDVALVGETTVAPNSTILYTLLITSNAPTIQQFAGFNLVIESPSGGAYAAGLTPIDNSIKTEFSELTHTSPKSNDANGVARFEFEWAVPAELGAYTIYYAGNSVDGDGQTSGDMSARRTQTLTVADDVEPPDPTNNQPPTVSFDQPTMSEFAAGSDIVISANAADDSAIASVQLFINGEARRLDDTAPYRWRNALTAVEPGIYLIELVAIDDVGVSSSAMMTTTVPADGVTPTPTMIVATETVTPTATSTPTLTPTTVTPTMTAVPTTVTPTLVATLTPTPTATATATIEPATATPIVTPTATATSTPMPTPSIMPSVMPSVMPTITPPLASPLGVDMRHAETVVRPDALLILLIGIMATSGALIMRGRSKSC